MMVKYVDTQIVQNAGSVANYDIDMPLSEEDQKELKRIISEYPGYSTRYADELVAKIVAAGPKYDKPTYRVGIVIMKT